MRWITGAAPTAACTAAAFLLGGCGGDSGVEPATAPKPSTPSAQVQRQLDDPRSPASTVKRFWDSMQNGALPLSLSLYEPRVVSAVGIATFAGMLADQRATYAETRLNILRVEDAANGRLVSAEAVPKVGLKTRHSFFLRRAGNTGAGRWRILYDTLSAAGIQSFVQTQIQRSVDPAAVPGRKAIAAGDQAAATYRNASLSPAPRRSDGDGDGDGEPAG